MAVKRWWQTPYATLADTKFPLLLVGIFVHSIGRVRYDGMHGMGRLLIKPGETIIVIQSSPFETKRLFRLFHKRQEPLSRARLNCFRAVHASGFTYKKFRRVKSQVRPD